MLNVPKQKKKNRNSLLMRSCKDNLPDITIFFLTIFFCSISVDDLSFVSGGEQKLWQRADLIGSLGFRLIEPDSLVILSENECIFENVNHFHLSLIFFPAFFHK